MPDLRTITGVELARVGTYDLSTGPYEFTPDDLRAAVANSAAGTQPRIKLGHVDPRFDGEPAMGVVTNMRLNDTGDVLVGDLANVPGWLADALPAAYPGRSIEASVTKDTGMRVTALALLGMTRPGIDTLADLEVALAAAARENPADPTVQYVLAAASQLRAAPAQEPVPQGPPTKKETPMDPKVQEFLTAQGLDPDKATEDQINAASVMVAAGALAKPATDDAAAAKAQADADAKAVADADQAKAEADAKAAEEAAAAVATVEDPLALAASAAIETLSAEVAELRAAAAEREEKETAERRDLLASAWLQEGRITLAEKPHYRGLLDIDEDGTKKLAASLAAGRVPVGAAVTTHTLADSEPTTTGWFPQLQED